MDLEVFRAQFPVTAQRTYLITGPIADVMARPGWGFLRVDPAGFNRRVEIDRFLDALAAALGEVER